MHLKHDPLPRESKGHKGLSPGIKRLKGTFCNSAYIKNNIVISTEANELL